MANQDFFPSLLNFIRLSDALENTKHSIGTFCEFSKACISSCSPKYPHLSDNLHTCHIISSPLFSWKGQSHQADMLSQSQGESSFHNHEVELTQQMRLIIQQVQGKEIMRS